MHNGRCATSPHVFPAVGDPTAASTDLSPASEPEQAHQLLMVLLCCSIAFCTVLSLSRRRYHILTRPSLDHLSLHVKVEHSRWLVAEQHASAVHCSACCPRRQQLALPRACCLLVQVFPCGRCQW